MNLLAPRPDFATQDSFLHAVLGLVSASRSAHASLPKLSEQKTSSGVSIDEDFVLFALLGAIALGRKVDDVAARLIADPVHESEESPTIGGFESIEDLLR